MINLQLLLQVTELLHEYADAVYILRIKNVIRRKQCRILIDKETETYRWQDMDSVFLFNEKIVDIRHVII